MNEEVLTSERLKTLFEYREGKLFWRNSPSRNIRPGSRAGTLQPDGYRHVVVNGRSYREHRLVWLLFNQTVPSLVDHINRVRDDNRIENLRPASAAQNVQNRGMQYNNSSGCAGVHWHKGKKKWHAKIGVNGRDKHIGYFSDKSEAVTARHAAEQVFGYRSTKPTQ